MNKKWELYNSNEELVREIEEKYQIPEVLATVLVNRGVFDSENIEVFLNPTRKDFHNPYDMPDMQKAVDRIIQAIENKEKVIIYGDYDVDGITSTMVLKKFLDENGLEVGYKIPNRLDEGYGLNMSAIKEIAEQGYHLIITVDCGISGVEEIKYAYELGMEVIVTDHHEPPLEMPIAVACIDCKRKDNKYPFKNLAGVGVVFKLIQALAMRLNLNEKEYLKYLDIVCIGTISDIVPLVDENRVIAKLGLKLVMQTKNPGLYSLINSVGFKDISSNTISFGIAPRINACGRMGHETEAVNLFLTNDLNEAKEITEVLNKYNKERQEIERIIFEEAVSQIEKDSLDKDDVIVVGAENWHHGVIGIVASKITDLYYKPTILVSFENGEAKGSGRSVAGFDLHDALCKCDDLLNKYGGHEMAVGLSFDINNFDEVRQRLNVIAKKNNVGQLIPIIKIDKEITSKDIKIEVAESLKKLEPFGEANKIPLFLYRNLKIDSIRALSEGKHIKLTLKDERIVLQAIGFNLGHLSNEYLIGNKVDVVGNLEINEFNGDKIVQINLKDMRKVI